jgi:hypothetical protein
MAESGEDWSDWENLAADGLAGCPWGEQPTAARRVKKLSDGRLAGPNKNGSSPKKS